MAKAGKRKFELVIPKLQATEALSQVAAGAAAGVIEIGGQSIPLAEFSSLKISLKHFGTSTLVKVKVKYLGAGAEALPPSAPEAARPDKAGKPRYASLKKRMKRRFRDIVAALRAGAAPHPEDLEEFVADARLMTSYPGKGDAFYPAFNLELDRLEAAAGDVAAMTEAAAALHRMKKECHSRHG